MLKIYWFLLASFCNPCFCIFVNFMGNMGLHLSLKQSFKEVMRFILFSIHEQHFFSKERSDTWPRVRMKYPFPSHFKISHVLYLAHSLKLVFAYNFHYHFGHFHCPQIHCEMNHCSKIHCLMISHYYFL